MTRLYITGTDTDVGKTRVTRMLARALVDAEGDVTIAKLVQTGLGAGVLGDAAEACADITGCRHVELARFLKPADPWTAALAERRTPPRAPALAAELATIDGPLLAEGSGGVAVPLNADESITDVACWAGLDAVLVVGLRMGCISHALMSIEYLEKRGVRIAGVVLCERWPDTPSDYADDVARILGARARIAGFVPHDSPAAATAQQGTRLLAAIRSR